MRRWFFPVGDSHNHGATANVRMDFDLRILINRNIMYSDYNMSADNLEV